MKKIKHLKVILIILLMITVVFVWFSQAVKIRVDRDQIILTHPDNNYFQIVSNFENATTDLPVIDAFESTCNTEVLVQDCEISFNVYSSKDQNYELAMSYLPDQEILRETSLSMKINNELPYQWASDMLVKREFSYTSDEFATDRMGNQFVSEQKVVNREMTESLFFRQAVGTDAVLVPLKQGDNLITFKINTGQISLKSVQFKAVQDLINYEAFQTKNVGEIIEGGTIEIQGYQLTSKSASKINVNSVNSPTFEPFDANKRLINSVNSASYFENGDTVTYQFDVDQAGYYPVTLRYQNPKKEKSTVFLDVLVNGQIPFKEFEMYPLGYSSQTNNYTFEYPVYLQAGQNEISFRINALPYQVIDQQLNDIRQQLNDLKITLIKITGNNFDRNRNWEISNFLPELESDLTLLSEELVQLQTSLLSYNNNSQTQEVLQLSLAISALERLSQNPDDIVANFSVLENLIGNIVKAQTLLTDQPISIDRIFIGDYNNLDPENASLITRISVGITRFINSFNLSQKESEHTAEINVWVKRSQQYVDQMQKYIDTNFTPKTGIKVNLAVTTDQSKITLAVASNTAPDGIMGIDSWYISDLALRGAVQDLRQMDGANDAIENAVPGALLQMIVEDQLFGLPEVQDTYVLFYRKDILESLGLDVPNTWDDVTAMLPTLQRYGMNFYTPLSGPESNKSWPGMAPFIMQNGAQVFSSDGMSVMLDTQESINAMTQMTEFFTIYSMPLQVGEFYNAFREGTTPIGVSNMSTYVKLMSAAPEIANNWDIALMPGIEQNDGTIARWSTGGSSALAIMNSSNNKDNTWEFFKWWLSDEVQTQFMFDMQMTYGNEYLWSSGNKNAFAQMPIDEDHLSVLVEQLSWVQEIPRIPGGYFAEREYSNAWNRIVFEGSNIRLAIDSSVTSMNRELRRKMAEFGYIVNGEVVKPYKVPTLQDIERWLSEDE